MTPSGEASPYDGTPEEQNRRSFMATATLVIGGTIGLVLGIPLLVFSTPGQAINELAGEQLSALNKADWDRLVTSETPLKISFAQKTQDGYFAPGTTNDYVWGVKMSDTQWRQMQDERSDLFGSDSGAHVAYRDRVHVAGFVVFSSICPHLGCRFAWVAEKNYFFCPCHNSAFARNGNYISGPSPRGLDPLPLRERSGQAKITWIRYKTSTPERIIVSYG